jgi:UDP-N-acetylglucosamine--N-acetylmuramyl-(pentapeptide) pyrophosphoryl-undecaprenol N-acetylglucosamine transferase
MNTPAQKPIVVMAGGTGGHVFPALAVAEYLRNEGETIIWLGTRAGIEARVVPAANFAIEWLSVQGLRGKGLGRLIMAPFILIRACWQAFVTLLRLRPKAVLGMGGFVSGPGGLVAWMLNIPLFIHEQNSVIGLTNQLLRRFAKKTYFAFPDAAKRVPGSKCIGNPVRAELVDIEPPEFRLAGRQDDPMQLLVIGGSLGAAALNRILPEAVALLDVSERPLIKHQCGIQHLEVCTQHYQQLKVDAEVSGFIEDMAEVYKWADLVVCRAGALTISELTAVGLAAILIPFPYATDNHQYYNALYLQQHDAAKIFVEEDLNANTLALQLRYFQQNRAELQGMSDKARSLAQTDAARILAQDILAGAKS